MTVEARLPGVVPVLRRMLFWLLALMLALPASASEADAPTRWAPRSERYSIGDGLPDLSLFSLVRDHDGYLWIGSARGIARFDGHRFRTYRHDPGDPHSLSHDNAGNLFVDTRGRLWVGTWGGGLNLVDPRTGRAQRYGWRADDPASLPSNFVQTFFEDAQHRIWIGTGNGLARYDEALQRPVRVFGDEAGPMALTANRIWGIAQRRDGMLWVAASDRLLRFDPTAGTLDTLPLPQETGAPVPLRLLFVDHADRLWTATVNAVYRYDVDAAAYRRVPLPDALQPVGLIANSLHRQSGPRYWVTSWRGLWLLDTDAERFVALGSGDRHRWFEADDIRGALTDPSGLLWLATRQSGLVRVNLERTRFRLFRDEIASLPGNFGSPSVVRIDLGDDGVWLQGGAGLVRADVDNGEFIGYDARSGPRIGRTQAIAFGNEGTLFYPAPEGAMRFDPARGRTERIEPLSERARLGGNDLVLVHRARDDRLWWITQSARYVASDLDGTLIEALQPSADSGAIAPPHCVHEDASGTLWMCTLLGLVGYDRATGFRVIRQVQSRPDTLSHDAVYALLHDADGQFWVGTQVALDLLDPLTQHAAHYVPDGMSILRVESIVEAAPGELWVASGGLLHRFDARQRRFVGAPLDPGVPGLFFHPRAAAKLDGDRLLFGTNQGLLVMDPDVETQAPFVPPVHVSAAWIDRTAVTLRDGEPLVLAPNARSLELEFVALDYRAPERNRYAYRLEGFDPDWRTATSARIAAYTNLAPGDYRFRVRAAGIDDVWADSEPVDIRVLPPWWADRTLQALAAALLALAVALAVRLHFRSIRLRQAVLQQQVSERTHDLEVARDAAEQAAHAKSTFLATMSHEIRTPLNAVIGFSTLGTQLELTPDQTRDYFRRISAAGRTLLGIVNDVLDFSRIEAGRLELERVAFDLDDVIARTRDLFADTAAHKGIALTIDVDADVPTALYGDPLRLGQVLTNLLGNALKFTEHGHVALHVACAEPPDGPDVMLRFAVDDSGIGIPAEQLPRLFEAFTQVDAGTTRRFGGSGLGLSIAQRLVALMHGRMTVESTLGVGSRFAFTARFQRDVEHVETPQAAAAAAPALHGAHVLLVEDNRANQDVAQTLLAQAGITIDVADSGERALALLSEHRYAAVLMDLHMPGMDGFETTARIRAQPQHATLPIIAMTAHAVTGYRERCLQAGMNDYLTKPIEPEALFETLTRWVGTNGA